MRLDALILNCPRCDAWYTTESAPCKEYTEDLKQVFFCDCSTAATKLSDAHEVGLITPYQEMKLDFLREEKTSLLRRVRDIDRQITDITGDEEY